MLFNKNNYTESQLDEIEELCREAFEAGVSYSQNDVGVHLYSSLDDKSPSEDEWINEHLKS